MIYKDPVCEDQLNKSPQKLLDIVALFDALSSGYGIEAVVTRVWDAVCGDSGVHEDHRAIDFRDETINWHKASSFLYKPEQTDTIVNTINERYPRNDGKLVCIHHSFHGMPHHFHIQIPANWVTKEDVC